MEKNFFFYSVCLVFISGFSLLTSNFSYGYFSFSNDILVEKLTEDGFENVSVSELQASVIISYENRIFRSEPEAAAYVIKTASTFFNKQKKIVLVPLLRKVPVLCIIYRPLNDSLVYSVKSSEEIEVSMNVEPYWSKIKNTPAGNSSNFKIDAVISPQIKMRFGNFDKIAESQINLAPKIKTILSNGFELSAEAIFPLHNDLDNAGDYIRPGIITLNQLLKLPFNSYASFTAGYFSSKRYGVDLDVQNFLFNGKISSGLSIGYTKMAFFDKGIWYYTNDHLVTYTAFTSYRLNSLDLNFKLSFGKFLQQDKGFRLEVNRQFGETELGFFCSKTSLSNNGGFYFSIPIFPSKYWKIKTVRVRPAETFSWEYRYKTIDEDLRNYDTGNRIDNMMKKFNPDYFKKQLIIFLKNF